MKKTITILAAFGMLAATNAIAAEKLEGVWSANNGASRIQISPCGSKLCSDIIWLKEPRKDAKNEDKSLRGRDIVGLRISNNMERVSDNKWKGSVYSPEKGKTYSGFATVDGNKLSMRGCLTSAGVLCQTRKFTRAN
ncbi:MAG: DUF2147 domain-containing protein [Pseudomonadota bacterium]